MEISILKHFKPEFDKRLEKINKKLLKYNWQPITIISLTETKKSFETPSGHKLDIPYLNITLVSPLETYKINGFSFFGCISHKDDIKQIYAATEEAQTKLLEFTDIKRCDHCHIDRYRTKIFLFKKDDNITVIGSGCVKEYFGIDIEKSLIKGIKYLKSLDGGSEEDEQYFKSYGQRYDDFMSILLLAMYSIEQTHGYIKDSVTSQQISYLNSQPISNDPDVVAQWQADTDKYHNWITDEKKTRAQEIINFWSNNETKNSFEFNIKQLFDNQVSKSFSLIACGTNIFYKINNLFPNKSSDSKTSEYVGTIGDKIELELKVLKYIPYESEWGNGNIILMESNGNIIKWKTGCIELPENKFRAKMTIKRHEEYKGTKQTQIQRLKIL